MNNKRTTVLLAKQNHGAKVGSVGKFKTAEHSLTFQMKMLEKESELDGYL